MENLLHSLKASQWAMPGLLRNCESMGTVNVISGCMAMAIYMRLPIALWYEVFFICVALLGLLGECSFVYTSSGIMRDP